jgi:hypothetical protein
MRPLRIEVSDSSVAKGIAADSLASSKQPIFVRVRIALFPVRPRVALLFVLFPAEGLDAEALGAVVADSYFRRATAHIANVVCMFRSGVRSLRGNYVHGCLRL